MRRLLRTGLLLAVAVVATLAVWQVASLLVNSQALAPVTGQYYVGASWMATPTPTAGPSPTATVLMTATPLPTSLPEATPEIQTVEAEPTAVPLPTPDSFVADVVGRAGIDPAGTFVLVNQNAQRMTIVKDGVVVRELAISTGDPDRGWYTPAWTGRIGEYWGTFSANGVSADNAWYLFKAGGSILIHSAPYTQAEDGSKLYQGMDDLGVFPASRGCIRISPDDATWFTDWGPYDVPIVILPWDGGTGREG
ncbi:MAG: L,D-transpeptidase [Caldilineae bacterium]|nr:L,D-transpeptidase [Anaerolineae bacterium]MCB9155033.1 L,D-transpeptidase [Caldilineae bacterium]